MVHMTLQGAGGGLLLQEKCTDEVVDALNVIKMLTRRSCLVFYIGLE